MKRHFDYKICYFIFVVVFLFFTLLFLSSCVTYNDCECSTSFSPVTCVRGHALRNFTNPCFAQCNGFYRCFKVRPENNNSSLNNSYNSCRCSRDFLPVVCKENGITRNFVNRCVAGCDGFYNCTGAVY